jgi:hypothetical protein
MVDHAKAKALYNVQWEIIEEAFHHSVQNRMGIPESESLYDYFESRAPGLLPDREDQGLLLATSEMRVIILGFPSSDRVFGSRGWRSVVLEVWRRISNKVGTN